MSEDDKSHIAVLLPAAQVALFTQDDTTKASFMALESDWRYARVGLEAISGDVETAIAHYASNEAPNLVIIQTEDIDDSFSDRLAALAEHMAENTAAIVIGPVNDVNLYRKLVGMGVSDYLVKPVETGPLGDDIAATLLEQIGAADSRLIALVGAKGGVGVTVLSEALAWDLSTQYGQKTFLMDASGGRSTLSVGMNFDPSTTLAEATRAAAEGSEDSLTRMIHQANDKLFVLSSGGDVMLDDLVEPDQYEALLDYVMALYPIVFVDLSAGTPGLQRTVLARAHQILLITTPVLPAVRAARTLMQEIKELRGGVLDDVEVILNMQNYAAKAEVPKSQIQEGLERPPSVVIPFNPDLFVSNESEAQMLHEAKQGTEIMESLLVPVRAALQIKQAADEKTSARGAGLGGILGKLKAKS